MIEVDFSRLFVFAIFVVASSAGAIRISQQIPWTTHSASLTSKIAGLALAPFLLGVATIVALTFAPEQPRQLQAGLVFLLVLLPLLLRQQGEGHAGSRERVTAADCTLALSWGLVASGLMFVAVFIPLTQNDALEYASAARVLFENNWIGAYPALDPIANSEGFFGPWTHPPMYVALIFLTNVLQGGSDAPGLMRLIAPWFAITASLAVFALTRPLGRTTALGASVVFLSTPLLFLGAASALLDALPISAFVLLLLAITQSGGSLKARSLTLGLLLGLSLWTHSLAILFIPLTMVGIFLFNGLRNFSRWIPEGLLVLAIALLAGGVHYVRNTLLFGAPISDNPAVFALPRLAWDEYFIINRGLDSVMATIQYGILKGWFAFEAFGLSFWGMAVGAILTLWAIRRSVLPSIYNGSLMLAAENRLPFILLGMLLTYFVGVVASVTLGIDLMIKNERYLLSIQGLIAVLCAIGYFTLSGIISRAFRNRNLPTIAAAVLGIALVLQSLIFVQYSLSKNSLTMRSVGQSFEATLAGVPEYQSIDYLVANTPGDAIILSLKPSDMYFSGRRQIGYLDPRLLPLYDADTIAEGMRVLTDLGVTFVHLPPYGLPPLYNSVLIDILRDRTVTALRFSNSGGQIYELSPSSAASAQTFDITPGSTEWSRESLFELGGRKRLSSVGSSEQQLWESNTSEAASPFGLFQRSLLTLVRTGTPELVGGAIETTSASEVGIDLDVAGHGLMTLIAVEYDDAGAPTSTPLGTFELSDTYPEMRYSRRFLLAPSTKTVSVVIQQQGQSTLTVKKASVVTYTSADQET